MIQTQRRFPTTVLAFTLAFFPTHLHSMLRHLFRTTPVTSLLNKPARTANKSVFTTFQKPASNKHIEQLTHHAYKSIMVTSDAAGMSIGTVDAQYWQNSITPFSKEHGNAYTSACLQGAQKRISEELSLIDKHNEHAQTIWSTAYAFLRDQNNKTAPQ